MKVLSNLDARNAGKVFMPIYATLAGLPSAAASKGSFAYADDTDKMYYSDGVTWVDISSISGAMQFKGVVAFNAAEPSSPSTGDVYIFNTAGSNTWEGTTVVEVGDLVVWDGSAWKFIQVNIGAASETVPGYVELATSAETITGTSTTLATHPAGVLASINANRVTSVGGTAGNVLTGDTSTTSFAVVHTASDTPAVVVRETTSGEYVQVDVTRTSATGFNIIFALAPAATPTYSVYVR